MLTALFLILTAASDGNPTLLVAGEAQALVSNVADQGALQLAPLHFAFGHSKNSAFPFTLRVKQSSGGVGALVMPVRPILGSTTCSLRVVKSNPLMDAAIVGWAGNTAVDPGIRRSIAPC